MQESQRRDYIEEKLIFVRDEVPNPVLERYYASGSTGTGMLKRMIFMVYDMLLFEKMNCLTDEELFNRSKEFFQKCLKLDDQSLELYVEKGQKISRVREKIVKIMGVASTKLSWSPHRRFMRRKNRIPGWKGSPNMYFTPQEPEGRPTRGTSSMVLASFCNFSVIIKSLLQQLQIVIGTLEIQTVDIEVRNCFSFLH